MAIVANYILTDELTGEVYHLENVFEVQEQLTWVVDAEQDGVQDAIEELTRKLANGECTSYEEQFLGVHVETE